MAAVDEVDAYLESVDGLTARRLAHGEWGITVPGDRVGGGPIEASLRIADGLLRAQAIALHAAGDLDPWMLLGGTARPALVRFALHALAGHLGARRHPGVRRRRARSGPPARTGDRGGGGGAGARGWCARAVNHAS